MKKIKKNEVIENPENKIGCLDSILTILSIGSIVFLVGIFVLDYDRVTGRFFGWESESYFVVEKYGYPYKLLKKKPGYQYRIENGEIVKTKIEREFENSVENGLTKSKMDYSNIQKNEKKIESYQDCLLDCIDGILYECSYNKCSKGRINCRKCGGDGWDFEDKRCLHCVGSGFETCPKCNGETPPFVCPHDFYKGTSIKTFAGNMWIGSDYVLIPK